MPYTNNNFASVDLCALSTEAPIGKSFRWFYCKSLGRAYLRYDSSSLQSILTSSEAEDNGFIKISPKSHAGIYYIYRK